MPRHGLQWPFEQPHVVWCVAGWCHVLEGNGIDGKPGRVSSVGTTAGKDTDTKPGCGAWSIGTQCNPQAVQCKGGMAFCRVVHCGVAGKHADMQRVHAQGNQLRGWDGAGGAMQRLVRRDGGDGGDGGEEAK